MTLAHYFTDARWVRVQGGRRVLVPRCCYGREEVPTAPLGNLSPLM